MKTQFVRVATEDKLILQGLLYEPENSTKKLILHIHGMAGNFYENRFLDAMAKAFTDSGWAFLTVNTRGHDFIVDFPIAGEKEKYKRIGNTYEIFEECIHDIKAWIDFAFSHRYKDLVLQGHSLGSVKSVYYLTKTQDKRVRKLVLASPPDMVGLAQTDSKYEELLKVAEQMKSEGKEDEILPQKWWSWYRISAKTFIDFGKKDNPIDVFNTYDKNKLSILSEIKVPTLAFFGSRDDAVILPIPEALEVLKSKTKNCPQFDTAIIEEAPHSYFGHEQEMVDLIIKWVTK